MSESRQATITGAVRVERDGALHSVILNNPERLNAVSEAMYDGIDEALGAAERDETCRVVLFRGQGRAFCVGADLKEHAASARNGGQRTAYVWRAQRVAQRLQRLSKPVIAAVHGHAYGAGAELALNADFLVIAKDAKMAFPEASLGTYVGGGITHVLPRLVGMAKARELLLLGAPFSGEEAKEYGLAYAAVDAESMEPAIRALTERLVEAAPISLQMMRRDLASGFDADFNGALAHEAGRLLACMATRDWAEGAAAFRDGRKPQFTGR